MLPCPLQSYGYLKVITNSRSSRDYTKKTKRAHGDVDIKSINTAPTSHHYPDAI